MQPVGKWRIEEPVQEAPVVPVGKWSVEAPVKVDTRDTDTFQAHMMLDEAIAREDGPQFDQAMFWADKYNADVSVPLEERVEAFNKKQSVDVLPSVTKAVKSAVSSGAFVAEMESRGLSEDVVVAALENISKVETNGGRNNTISTGGAGGILQVIPSTFDDLLSRDVVGPKALKSLGKTKEELLALSNEEKGNYLKGDDKAAAIFGLAAFLNKMERQ